MRLDLCERFWCQYARRARDQQDDDTPPPPPPPQLTPYERASMDMLAGITRLLERQSEHSEKSHEEDLTERFRKQGPKEFAGLNLIRTVRPSRTCLGNLDG
ncbi:putative galacturonosyltransferase 7 [Dorcoceras hygrometricum]|uniref:Putative galacturonosyltransferase 7 n=1 Tax=Dorcoceras hygrometricum TaxID=472368 RepID=A0A2Z7CA30_9LAMI|nr:putative galacturonosyltransferase 7 [Dorcoceras hygrometricum]